MPRSLLQAPEPLEHLEPSSEEPTARARAGRSLAYRVASGLGIATIVLVGGVFWVALGTFVSAWDSAVSAFNSLGVDRTDHFLPAAPASASPAEPIRIRPTVAPTLTATPVPVAATRATAAPTPAPSPQPSPSAQPSPTAQPSAEPSPTPGIAERAPWVLLPQPPPGARVPSGPLVVEARGRGDAPISEIRLELDGKPLPVAVDQRSDVIWRGAASTQVGSGHHSVKAFVVDAQGRTGSYGWTFDADG